MIAARADKRPPTDKQLALIAKIEDRVDAAPKFSGTTLTQASEYIDKWFDALKQADEDFAEQNGYYR